MTGDIWSASIDGVVISENTYGRLYKFAVQNYMKEHKVFIEETVRHGNGVQTDYKMSNGKVITFVLVLGG